MKDFKTDDTVTIGQHGTVQWKLMSKAGRNTFVCRSLSSGKIYPHSTASMKLVKIESKGRSELYKLLPRVSEWGDGMIFITIDFNGLIKSWTHKPVNNNPYFIKGWCFSGTSGEHLKAHTDVNLPPSINWKDTLVSREEMEAWERSQVRQNEMFLHTTTPVGDYYRKLFEDSFTETPQAKVERLKAELKEAEAELEKVTPVEFPDVVLSLYVMVGKEWAPEGLKHKCLMFNSNRLRMEQSPHGDFTVLTFFEK